MRAWLQLLTINLESLRKMDKMLCFGYTLKI